MCTQVCVQGISEHIDTHVQIEHLYSVSGNMDQLKKKGLDTEHTWIPHARQPNSVKTLLPFEQAQALYTKLKDLGLVAFKNWL